MQKDITCFLIDDDIDDLEIFAIAIAEMGRPVICTTANDGMDALEKLRQDETFTPDYIFLDLNMPRMNGKQCLVEIRKIERLTHTSVVMYSTSALQRDIDDTLQLGASHFLTKPTSISKLTETLQQLLQK